MTDENYSRYPLYRQKTVRKLVHLPPSVVDEIKEIAKQKNTSVAHVCSYFVQEGLAAHKKENKS